MQFVREILVVIVVVAAVSFAEEAATGQLDCEAQLLSSDAAVNKILMLVDKNATGYKTIQRSTVSTAFHLMNGSKKLENTDHVSKPSQLKFTQSSCQT